MTNPKVGRIYINRSGKRLILEIKDATGYIGRYCVKLGNMRKLLKNQRREVSVSRMDS